MIRTRQFFGAAIVSISVYTCLLHAQVPNRLLGQDYLGSRRVAQGSAVFDSLILRFGSDPVVYSAEFRVNYRRGADPQTGTLELLIWEGLADDAVTTSAPVLRRALTPDELVALANSPSINVEPANVELILVESQQGGIARRAAQWSGQR
jgi:hypothetical protein